MRYDKLVIDNYRGIRHAEIEGFANVNLFFGRNNCGKSSILESLLLISGQSNPNIAFVANSLRGMGQYSKMATDVEFYGASKSNEINIKTEGDDKRELHLREIESNGHEVSPLEAGGGQRYYGLLADYSLNGASYVSRIVFSEDNPSTGNLQVDKRYKGILKCRILGSTFLQTEDVNSSFADIVKQKKEEDVLEVLKIVEPGLRDIQLVGDYFMVDVGLASRLPVNVLGDGFRKALNIILAMHECANGALLIDEMDNGLHYSVMPKLWEAVFKSSIKDNVQVFVTTHSLDLLNGLKKCVEANPSYQHYFAAYKLNKTGDDTVMALRYSYPMIDFSLTQEIEMR